jgi:heterodisulfide reductase subunit A-like polyferredoxin
MHRKLVSRIAASLWTEPYTDCWAEDKDLVIIGGGVAGYVAAIKAGQAGMKVSEHQPGDSIVGRADM